MPACQDADLEIFLKQKIDMLHLQKTGLLLVGRGFLLLPLGTVTICLLSKPCTWMLVPHTSRGSTGPTAWKTFWSAGQHSWMSNECTFRWNYVTIQLFFSLEDQSSYSWNASKTRKIIIWCQPGAPLSSQTTTATLALWTHHRAICYRSCCFCFPFWCQEMFRSLQYIQLNSRDKVLPRIPSQVWKQKFVSPKLRTV